MNMQRLLKTLPFFLYLLSFGTGLVAQETNNSYYISENGNNANTGSSSSPFKTIAYALTKLNDNDELILKAGTYREVIKANHLTRIYALLANQDKTFLLIRPKHCLLIGNYGKRVSGKCRLILTYGNYLMLMNWYT